MTELASAPVADWVRIPELYDDPFPTFERLRAEGGVHWVPAVGRYLITSYAAVHETELDQEVYSANEQGSLMIRAMGHSMLRRDDPEHRVERRAWQPALKPAAIQKVWTRQFRDNAQRYLAEFADKGPCADLVWDFAAPYVAENLRLMIGLYHVTQEDLQRWSQTMIDATGNYADDPKVWELGKKSFDEVDDALDEMLQWHSEHPDESLISHLLAIPDYKMPLDRIRANLKMTIGGGINEPRDAIGVAVHCLLENPDQRAKVMADPSLWNTVFDESIRWVAPIGMYSRQTTRETVLAGVPLPAGARLGICLLSANRDTTVWPQAERWDIEREVHPHLAFGKGVHVCAGAPAARAAVAEVALPMLFRALPDLAHDPEKPATMGGWVFRGMTSLPVTWSTADLEGAIQSSGTGGAGEDVPTPSVAVVGSGPSGCFSAQALRRTFPESEIHVLEKLPVPFGLVRSGVASDQQGTKSIARQFQKLFTEQGISFHGNVSVEGPEALAELRHHFDVVVLATGLRADRRLDLPGDDLPGVIGAGRLTRLLNTHPDEEELPCLGSEVVVVGLGNVGIDVVRLLVRASEDFESSDVHDEAREELVRELRTVHVVGRSGVPNARFDPAMMRELALLGGVEHVVHAPGMDESERSRDARVDAVLSLPTDVPGARLRVEWWFGYPPAAVVGDDHVEGFEVDDQGQTKRFDCNAVITAVGFAPEDDAIRHSVDEHGRVEPGLYAAGWLRRGPRGTIADQRTDARALAAVIKSDIAEGRVETGLRGWLPPADATDHEGWRRIDELERSTAREGRVRSKLKSVDEMLRAARGASIQVTELRSTGQQLVVPEGGVSIWFGTESGNAELAAQRLAEALGGDEAGITARDLSGATPADLRDAGLCVMVCSTYGDGEIASSAKDFLAALRDDRPDLSGVQFAMFGLGDRSYARTYSRGSELLTEALEACGAKRVGEYGRHDAGTGEPVEDAAQEWLSGVLDEAAARSG